MAKTTSKTKTISKAKTKKTDSIWATGKRKSAIAVVNLKKGKGKVVINKKNSLEDYFPLVSLAQIVLAPLDLLNKKNDFDLVIRVKGGGKKGQAEAIRLGVARALNFLNSDWRKKLKPAGFFTRDARVKERKKPGLKRARRAPQWRKR